MMSERAAFQSCLSEFMVLVEEMEKVEVVTVDKVVDKVDKVDGKVEKIDKVDKVDVKVDEEVDKVDKSEEEEDNEDDLQSCSEEYKSARASFGSYLEDKGRHVFHTKLQIGLLILKLSFHSCQMIIFTTTIEGQAR